jgi:rhodanese-related sulfurtransferase/predicted metal-dependent enzyme (double-stranded beta helix superfamily)
MLVHSDLSTSAWFDQVSSLSGVLSPEALSKCIADLAAQPDLWRPLVRHDPDRRFYQMVARTGAIDVMVICWMPGQGNLPHDHGEANGALTVVEGGLAEYVYDGPSLSRSQRIGHGPGSGARFPAEHIHRVINESSANAVSIHAYSPGDVPMRFYASSADRLVERSRVGLVRLDPVEAAQQARDGALLVDIRPEAQRRQEGEVPGALVDERNVLEYRLDPLSHSKLPEFQDYSQRVIVFCSQGYASSLAASSLRQMGLVHATDVEGGFKAWRAAGLPVT